MVSNKQRFLPEKWWAHLTNLRGRTFQVYFYLYTFNIYHLVRRDFRDKYETLEWNGASAASRLSSTILRSNQRPASSQAKSHRYWFPDMPKSYVLVRYLTTIYMIYIFIKTLMPNQIRYLIDLMNLEKPVHCYTLGRFKIHPRINEHIAAIFAGFHLVWRVIMVFLSTHRRIFNNTFFFLMLDELDREDFYKLVASKQFIEAKNARSKRLMMACEKRQEGINFRGAGFRTGPLKIDGPKARLMRDVMCYRVDLSQHGRTTYRLRPNRTREAGDDLVRFIAHVTLIATVIFLILAFGVGITAFLHVVRCERYLHDYANCDPLLEQLRRDNKLDEWWRLSPFRHQTIALAVDILENTILWLECGLVSVCFVSYAVAFNYDNIIYWSYLRKKIEALLEVARNSDGAHYKLERGVQEWDQSVYEMHMEMRDFIGQLAQSNKIITDLVSMALSVWFILFAIFNYGVISQKQRGFPIELSLVLMFVFAVMSGCWFDLLVLHKRCIKSYPLFCSLMALDQSRYKRRHTRILDYFTRNKHPRVIGDWVTDVSDTGSLMS